MLRHYVFGEENGTYTWCNKTPMRLARRQGNDPIEGEVRLGKSASTWKVTKEGDSMRLELFKEGKRLATEELKPGSLYKIMEMRVEIIAENAVRGKRGFEPIRSAELATALS